MKRYLLTAEKRQSENFGNAQNFHFAFFPQSSDSFACSLLPHDNSDMKQYKRFRAVRRALRQAQRPDQTTIPFITAAQKEYPLPVIFVT